MIYNDYYDYIHALEDAFEYFCEINNIVTELSGGIQYNEKGQIIKYLTDEDLEEMFDEYNTPDY